MNYINLTFKRLEERDLDLMHKWLNTVFVIKWFGHSKTEYTIEDVNKRYLPRINREQPTHPYLIIINNQKIGYIQTYLISDYPDYSQYVAVNECAAGLDLFIGEKEYLNKGLGNIIIRKFLREYVFELTDAQSCIIGPEPNNKVAIKAYEKAGFKYLKTIQIPDEKEPEYLMKISKNDLI